MKIVFGFRDIASKFAKHRKPFKKKGMTVEGKNELVKNGSVMLMNDSLPDTPPTPEFMDRAYSPATIQVLSNCLSPL